MGKTCLLGCYQQPSAQLFPHLADQKRLRRIGNRADGEGKEKGLLKKEQELAQAIDCFFDESYQISLQSIISFIDEVLDDHIDIDLFLIGLVAHVENTASLRINLADACVQVAKLYDPDLQDGEVLTTEKIRQNKQQAQKFLDVAVMASEMPVEGAKHNKEELGKINLPPYSQRLTSAFLSR